MYIYTHIHTHTYIRVHISIQIYIYIYTHIYRQAYVYTHPNFRQCFIVLWNFKYIYVFTHTDTQVYIHAYIYIHTYIYTHKYIYTYVSTHIHTTYHQAACRSTLEFQIYVHIHIYTYTHKHAYAYKYIYTHIYPYISTHTVYLCIYTQPIVRQCFVVLWNFKSPSKIKHVTNSRQPVILSASRRLSYLFIFFKSRILTHELAQPAFLAVTHRLSHLLYLISFSIQVTNSLPPLVPPPLAHCSPSPFVSIFLLFYSVSNSSHKISSSSQSASLQPIAFYVVFILKKSEASIHELPSARILFTVAHRASYAFSFHSVSTQVTTFLFEERCNTLS